MTNGMPAAICRHKKIDKMGANILANRMSRRIQGQKTWNNVENSRLAL